MSVNISSTVEEWKAIPGYEGIYSASNLGRIRREPWKKSLNGNILKPYGKPNGYVRVNLGKNGNVTTIDVHRLVLFAFRGIDQTKPVGNHIDRNKRNNRLENLEWCTQADNLRHSIRMMYGAFPKPRPPKRPPQLCVGEEHYAHKLTANDVREIRRLYNSGEFSQQCLADRFGINQTNISCIVLKKKWKHVT